MLCAGFSARPPVSDTAGLMFHLIYDNLSLHTDNVFYIMTMFVYIMTMFVCNMERGPSQCQSLNRSQCECGSIGRSARPVAQGMPLLSTTVQLRTRSCAYHGATTHPRAPTLQWAQAWTCRFSFQEIATQGRCCACAEDLVRATQQE